jgi:D-alanyl-D-alanine carboxypeptidase/D-alanyl-D-alanine-endopeptidase (penicillin-binding protein 4)
MTLRWCAAVAIMAAVAAVPAAASAAPRSLPAEIQQIMNKPRYATATWSLLVADVRSGRTLYALRPNRMSFTGSTRKLFSVGLALDTLGARHRQTTPVYRRGRVDASGTLHGDLVLAGAGDLTFGGRRLGRDGVQYTDFDHNDANSLGSAILTPQDPLFAVDALARQVHAAGIRSVTGDVAVDDRLFVPYRVPNGNLLITPMMLNENMVDVTIAPATPGQPATVAYRPRTAAFSVGGSVTTGAAGSDDEVALSDRGRIECIGQPGCAGTVSGSLPFGYRAPLTALPSFVGTFRVEDPAAFARTAFVEALQRAGVTVGAPVVAPNPRAVLAGGSGPPRYPLRTRVGAYRSAPFAQVARLVLKVSLNLGANLSLSLFGLEHGQRTIDGSLKAERRALIRRFGVDGSQFRFPTNGSGTPDSQASPRALVALLRAMARTPVHRPFHAALPVMGVDGSLAHTGNDLPGRGHVFAKPGTTIVEGSDGHTLELTAQTLAGYITTRSGRRVAYALMVNDVGAIADIENGVSEVFTDEGAISNAIYESL